jgi:hypothetical protein
MEASVLYVYLLDSHSGLVWLHSNPPKSSGIGVNWVENWLISTPNTCRLGWIEVQPNKPLGCLQQCLLIISPITSLISNFIL